MVFDEEMFTDAELVTELKAHFVGWAGRCRFQYAAGDAHPSATSLPNPRGTAPGLWVEKNGKVVVVMPGPPREMLPDVAK